MTSQYQIGLKEKITNILRYGGTSTKAVAVIDKKRFRQYGKKIKLQ